ncbi:visgun [Haemaphysalis longicornis]
MRLLVAVALLCGLWAVARCEDPTGTTKSPSTTTLTTAATNGSSTTASPSPSTTTTSSPPVPVEPNTTTAAPQPSTMSPQPQTTTVHPNTTTPVPSTTHLPTTVPPTSAPPEERHFDTLSFLGGIILTLGGLAIFYVGFKFYKARTERNYHTL